MKIETYLDKDYSNSALYICYRSIASYIDGLKPSHRKIVYTIKKQNITKEQKVSTLASAVIGETEYLHGDTSMQGSIVTLAQSFTGANNLPLLSPEGNFGTRMLPSPSASRYIFTKKTEDFDKIFRAEDDEILISQEFEGSKIEPKYYLPTLPMILINGSEGIGVGYAQKILPRSPEGIKTVLIAILKNKSYDSSLLYPWFHDFRGKISKVDENVWMIEGLITKTDATTLEISELPIGYSLTSYIKVLKSLKEKEIIKGYTDLSENDQFKFKISVNRSFFNNPQDTWLDLFKLRIKITEIFTCIDENNSIRIFESAESLLKSYIEIKRRFLGKRKTAMLENINTEITHLSNIVRFCKEVIEKCLLIENRKKKEIEEELESKEYDKEKNSFDYLLNLPLSSLTKERYESLQKQLSVLRDEYQKLSEKTEDDLWLNDLKAF